MKTKLCKLVKLAVGILLLFNVNGNLFAQFNAIDSSLQIRAHWKKGDVLHYRLENLKTILLYADTISIDSISYNLDIEVLDEDAEKKTIVWTFSTPLVKSKNKALVKLTTAIGMPKINYTVDNTGAFIEVLNWEELLFYYKSTFATLKREDKLVAGYLASYPQIEAAYTDKKSLEAMGIRELRQFHMFYGHDYTKGKEIKRAIKVPNGLREQAFDGTETEEFTSVDERYNAFDIMSVRLTDEKQFADAMREASKKVLEEQKISLSPENEIKVYKSGVITSLLVNAAGLQLYSEQSNVLVIDMSRVYDNTRIILLKAQ